MEKAEHSFNDDFFFGDVEDVEESCKNEEKCKEEKCEEECDKELDEDYPVGAKDLRGENVTIADYVKANFNELPGTIAVKDDPDNERSFFVVSKNYADRYHDLIDFVRIEDDVFYNDPAAVFYINGAKPQPSLFDESLNEEVEVNINDNTAAEDAVKIEDSEQEPIKEELLKEYDNPDAFDIEHKRYGKSPDNDV